MTVAVLSYQRRHSSLFKASSAFPLPGFLSRKHRISHPYSARYQHEPIRSGAGRHDHRHGVRFVSAHENEPRTADDLRGRAITLIDALLNIPNLPLASTLLSAKLSFQHDSASHPVTLNSRGEFLAFWEEAQRTRFVGAMGMGCRIREAVVDERQRKVWVVGEMRGVSGSGTDGEGFVVEMLSFDGEGRVCDMEGYRRRVRGGRGRED